MTRVFLASFILMGVFLLPYFAYIFGRDIPFSRTTLDIGNLLWPLAIFAVLLYEDKKEKLGIWRNPSLGMNLKTAILSLALGALWQLIILLLTSLFDAPNTDPREPYTLATLILHIFSFSIIGPIAEELFLRESRPRGIQTGSAVCAMVRADVEHRNRTGLSRGETPV